MHFLSSVLVAASAFASISLSAPTDLEKRAAPIKVTLESAGNTAVKVTVANTGATDLHFFKYNSFFDDAATVQKLFVLKDGKQLAHEGILASHLRSNLDKSNFVTVPAGATHTTTIDVATVNDLSAGGAFHVVAQGALPLASADFSTLSTEAIAYESNLLAIDVDGAKAAAVPKAVKILGERTLVASCSNGNYAAALRQALSYAVSLAGSASQAASGGSSSKFFEYYRTTSGTARSTVAGRLNGVVRQSQSSTGGGTVYHCGDYYGYCSPNVLAYTLPSQNAIANCPLYYSALPPLTGSCHAQDQTTTSIHEFTHAPATYSPGTQDNAYGYSASIQLSSSQAINNADTYALYSNAIYVGC